MGFGKPPFAMKLVLALGLLGAASSARAAYLYDMLDLGSLSLTLKNTHVSGINDAGQVVGWSYDNGTYRAFRTAPNSKINPATDDLGALGGQSSKAYAINNLGQVVGSSADRAFRTAPNAGINPDTDALETPVPYKVSVAFGINDLGEVVGRSELLTCQGFRTAPNAPINPATDALGGFLGGGVPYAINNAGQVVGASALPSPPGLQYYHAFRTASNAPINPAADDLGTLGGLYSVATAINNLGQVVGYSYVGSDGLPHAFRTAPNAPINPATDDLGDLGFGVDTSAYAINDAGDVVGVSGHAFIYTGGKMYDINDLVPSRPAWLTLYDARGINNRGQIVVSGYGHDGIERAYLLTPIPEPGCLSLAFLGIFALRRRSR